MSRVRAVLAVLVLAGWMSSACDTARTVAPLDVAPVANTAVGAVQRLAWAFNHRDVEVVAGLLTDDFVFQSAGQDSAGNTARDSLVTRGVLLGALRTLFEGAPGIPRPSRVSLTFDANPVPFPDPRPGRDPDVHRSVRTSLDLVVVDSTAQGTREVTGHGVFFLTRGDSASIPAELKVRGVKPDSLAWWIDRWEDETIGGSGVIGAQSNPARRLTFWDVLRFSLRRVGAEPLLAQRHP